MNGSGISASDVLALTKDNDGFGFGGVGGFILLFIFLIALGGNGFGWGNNGNVNQMATADLLYNQSTDSAIRGLAQGQCNIIDTVLNANYNNLLASKDISNQISNQTQVITSAMAQNTNAIINQMTTNVVNDLRDKLQVARDENSNLVQNQYLLSQLAITAPKMPCYYGTGCGCNSLY